MTELICLRHGEAESNFTQTLAPSLPSPLTARGRAQAAAAGEALRHRPAVRIYSSAAARAVETATIVAKASGLEVVQLEGLNEVEIGPDADPVDPKTRLAAAEALRCWVVDENLDQDYIGGETGRDAVRRTTGSLRAIVSDHPDETVVVVAHVASLTVALSALCDLHGELWGHPLPHAEPFTVMSTGDRWVCEDWPTETVGGRR